MPKTQKQEVAAYPVADRMRAAEAWRAVADLDGPIERSRAVLRFFISVGDEMFNDEDDWEAWNRMSYVLLEEIDKIEQLHSTAFDALHPLVRGPKEVVA